jgi:hypothetical protein
MTTPLSLFSKTNQKNAEVTCSYCYTTQVVSGFLANESYRELKERSKPTSATERIKPQEEYDNLCLLPRNCW